MTKKIISILVVLPFFVGAFIVADKVKASARTANWSVAVHFQNVGTAPAEVTVSFYAEGSTTPITIDPLSGGTLAVNAAGSFFIGDISEIESGFNGNAVMSSDQPLVATVVTMSEDPGFRMRLFSNGFSSSDASEQYLIATALKNKFYRTTVFSIQNTQSTPVTATVQLINADTGVVASTIDHIIPGNSSKFIEMDNLEDTGPIDAQFNGSAIITVPSERAIVSAANEYFNTKDVAGSFEGIPLNRTGTTMYMATALCNQFNMKTAYAVQNASLTESTNITVYYKDTSGIDVSFEGPHNIGPGQKKSILTCDVNNDGFTGSAMVVSSNPLAPIAVMGKASCGNPCVESAVDKYTTFLGEKEGSSKLSAPFIRWSNDENFNDPNNSGEKQRSNLAIQNLETSSIKVIVEYYGKDGGSPSGTQILTIPGFSKGNSNARDAGALGIGGMIPGEFGYYTDGSFGGSAIIKAHSDNPNAKFISIVRNAIRGAAEDYNNVPIQ